MAARNLVVLALVKRLHSFLMGAAIGTYLFALALWRASFYERCLQPIEHVAPVYCLISFGKFSRRQDIF